MVSVVLIAVGTGPALVPVDLGVSACRALKIALTDRRLPNSGTPCVLDYLEAMNLVLAAALGCPVFR